MQSEQEIRNNHSISAETKSIQHLQLSQRELEVLQLIGKGLSNKEIGDQLFLSESTIKTHVSNILSKLQVKRRTQALIKARELGVIQ